MDGVHNMDDTHDSRVCEPLQGQARPQRAKRSNHRATATAKLDWHQCCLVRGRVVVSSRLVPTLLGW